jgi:hypothetical protein
MQHERDCADCLRFGNCAGTMLGKPWEVDSDERMSSNECDPNHVHMYGRPKQPQGAPLGDLCRFLQWGGPLRPARIKAERGFAGFSVIAWSS